MSVAKVKLNVANASIRNDVEVLNDIHLPNKNIVIYQRDIENWQKELNQLTVNSFSCQSSGTTTEIMEYFQSFTT